jgi:hypothetical protein
MASGGPSGQVVLTRGLNCPNCGAALTMRAAGHSLTIVCEHCHSVLDAKDENYKILSHFETRMQFEPLIPLGSRGRLSGVVWEVIGVQVRTIEVDGTPYSWSEHLLFNPYHGFRYLTHYQGHWNFVRTVHALPVSSMSMGKQAVVFQNQTFTHFQTATAETTFVLGEFPWEVQVGDTNEVRDYIAPPRMMSSEATAEEITWSLGHYTPAAEITQAFKLSPLPPPEGVFADQANPYAAKSQGIWGTFGVFLIALIVLAFSSLAMSAKKEILSQDYSFHRGQGEPSFVTEPFELAGRTSTVELAVDTDVNNNWAYFNFALINEETGKAYDFGREISFYRDSEGSEGSRNDATIIPSVPPGRYYLRVEPETPDSAYDLHYHITLRRDVPVFTFFWLALAALAIPPIMMHWRSTAFEGRRWMESDYAPASALTSSSGDDE